MRIQITLLFILLTFKAFSNEALVNATFGWNTEKLKVNDFKKVKIEYYYDKSGLTEDSKKVLDSVYVFIQCHPYAVFYIENHTDSRGNERYNSQLTMRRAKACVDYLIQKGITPDRLEAFGKGEEELIYSDEYIKENAKTKNEKELLHQKNRRTVLRVKSIDYNPLNAIDLLENTTFLETDEKTIQFLVGEKAKTVTLSRFEKTYLNWLFTNYITDEFQKQNRYYLIYKDDDCKYKILLFLSEEELLNGILLQTEKMKKYKFDSCEKTWEMIH